MLKLIYRRCVVNNNTIDGRITRIAQEIGPEFGYSVAGAISRITARNTLGITEFADDFDLPHLEVTESAQQGLALIEFVSNDGLSIYHSLVLVVDPNHPARTLTLIMANLLEEANIQLLRECHTEQTFTKIIKEMEHV